MFLTEYAQLNVNRFHDTTDPEVIRALLVSTDLRLRAAFLMTDAILGEKNPPNHL